MGKISRKFFRLKNEESGQALVLFVLTAAVVLGSAAFAVDLGQSFTDHQKMQNTADIAAMTAASYLSSWERDGAQNAIEAAYRIAEENGVKREEVTVTTPYDGDPMMIKVECQRNVKYQFAQVFDKTDGNVYGSAVARKENYWAGEALPFLNMDGPYWDSTYGNNKKDGAVFTIWDKNNNSSNPLPGNFDRISDKEDGQEFWKKNKTNYSKEYYTVDYSNGVTVVNGRRAYIKDHIQDLYDSGATIYLFSLSQDVIESQKYNRTTVGNKTNIPLEDLVLLQVELVSYNQKGSDKNMTVKVLDIYDVNNGEYPTTFLRGGVSTKLLE